MFLKYFWTTSAKTRKTICNYHLLSTLFLKSNSNSSHKITNKMSLSFSFSKQDQVVNILWKFEIFIPCIETKILVFCEGEERKLYNKTSVKKLKRFFISFMLRRLTFPRMKTILRHQGVITFPRMKTNLQRQGVITIPRMKTILEHQGVKNSSYHHLHEQIWRQLKLAENTKRT